MDSSNTDIITIDHINNNANNNLDAVHVRGGEPRQVPSIIMTISTIIIIIIIITTTTTTTITIMIIVVPDPPVAQLGSPRGEDAGRRLVDRAVRALYNIISYNIM